MPTVQAPANCTCLGLRPLTVVLCEGGAVGRSLDAKQLEKVPLSRGRVYTEEELWTNMQYFLDKVLPVCQEAGVKLALHPNDPPLPTVAGVPCLMRNWAAYEKAFSLANDSPYLGMEFCCGCWLEGGLTGFGNLYEALPSFIARGKVLIIHLRNVTHPLPTFTETFIDGGYGDMCRLLRIMVTTGYDGTVILDHSPPFPDSVGEGAVTAFAVGYMKAALRSAEMHMLEAASASDTRDAASAQAAKRRKVQ